MAVIDILERLRNGYRVTSPLDFLYEKLMCVKEEVHTKVVPDHSFIEGASPIFACHFCPLKPYQHFVAVANEDGAIAVKDTRWPKLDSTTLTSVQGHFNAVFDLVWANHGKRLISASGDHTVVLWDVGRSSIEMICRFIGHSRSVKSISCKPHDMNIIATGARDGNIMIWDTRCVKGICVQGPEKSISSCHVMRGSKNVARHRAGKPRLDSITGLAFQNENAIISCSAGDGVIKVWDIRKTYLTSKRFPQARHLLLHDGSSSRNGFTNLTVGPCGLKLYANCTDNTVYCYDIGTYKKTPISGFKGHMVSSFYIKNSASPDGRFIASGSSDEKAYIWSVKEPKKPLVILQGHCAEVTCLDWMQTGELKMVSCSDDATYRIWRVLPDTIDKNDPNIRGFASGYESHEKSGGLFPFRPGKRSHSMRSRLSQPFGIEENVDINRPPQPAYLRRPQNGADGTCSEKRSRMLSPLQNIESPTLNLPNLVIDGTSPHNHRCPKSDKTPGKNDWLTALRQTTPQPKSPPIPPRRRSTNTNERSAKGSLLKFFKVAAKQPQNNLCDQSDNASKPEKDSIFNP